MAQQVAKGRIVPLFGELAINVDDKAKHVYRAACEVAENCGYVVTYESLPKGGPEAGYIDFYGEDCDDSLNVVNRAYVATDGKTITRVERRVLRPKGGNSNEFDLLKAQTVWSRSPA